MNRKTIPLGSFAANCTLIWDQGPDCWVVDPGGDGAELVAEIKAAGLRPALVALTHAHFDHIGAIPQLLAAFPGLPVHLSAADEPMFNHPMNAWPPDYERVERPASLVADLAEGVRLEAAGVRAEVLATPGHTPGSVCLRFDGFILTGDTLFAGSCGRTDFPGGSMAEMRRSLARLMTLPPELEVVPGHGPATTIGREKQGNPYVG